MAISRENWLRSITPAGTIIAFAGATPPSGWLLCNGSAISRTTYSALFSAIGTAHGQGDGSATFNLPDYRGQFLRGRVDINTVTGSGTVPASPNNNRATFTNHGINRTGFKVRVSSGTLGGLAASTDYFAIVVDANTLAFATTLANALAGTRITLTASSVNSAVLAQWEDPGANSRAASTVGGSSGNSIGASQEDAMQGHRHGFRWGQSSGTTNPYGSLMGNSISTFSFGQYSSTSGDLPIADPVNGTPKTDFESRPKNLLVNYIIKI
jgi:microcystin-dependent protein